MKHSKEGTPNARVPCSVLVVEPMVSIEVGMVSAFIVTVLEQKALYALRAQNIS